MSGTPFNLIILLLLLAGSIWLQVFLSRKRNKWLGLIIPIICFMYSIIIVLSLSIYTNTGDVSTGDTSMTQNLEERAVIDQSSFTLSEKPGLAAILSTIIPVFLVTNISTLIYLAIYFAAREKLKTRDGLGKMKIQDLE